MDQKQIEVVQKLIRLANNNPNENEANTAARKVCKMLAEFKWNDPIKVNFKPAENNSPTGRTDYKPYNSPKSYPKEPFDFVKWYNEWASGQKEREKDYYDSFYGDARKSAHIEREFNCAKCGKPVKGAVSPLRIHCVTCEWEIHREKESK